MPGIIHRWDVTTCINWHMSDVECDDILSCDCSLEDEDSSKWILRLSTKDK